MAEGFRTRDGGYPGQPPSEALRGAVRRRGLSAWKLARLSGVSEHVARRFMTQDSRIRSDTLDQLCAALGLVLLDPAFDEDTGSRAKGG